MKKIRPLKFKTMKQASGTYGTLVHLSDSETCKKFFKDSNEFGFGEITEIDILKKLSVCQYIVKVKEFLFRNKASKKFEPVEIIMERATSDLEDFIKEKFLLDFKKNLLQLFLGLSFLHYNKIVHYDIKPHNLLLFQDQFDTLLEKQGIIKYCDFGLSYCLSENEEAPDFFRRTVYFFKSPELIFQIKGLSLNDRLKSDIWSLAITIFFLITGKYLFFSLENEQKVLETIFQKSSKEPEVKFKLLAEKLDLRISSSSYNIPERKKYIEYIEESLRELIPDKEVFSELLESMLEINVSKRSSIFEILEHKYFQEFSEQINKFKKYFFINRIPKKTLSNIDRSKRDLILASLDNLLMLIDPKTFRTFFLAIEHLFRYCSQTELSDEEFKVYLKVFLNICKKTLERTSVKLFKSRKKHYELENPILIDFLDCNVVVESIFDYFQFKESQEWITLLKKFLNIDENFKDLGIPEIVEKLSSP
jgi:serine/threonine protein kinase